MQQPMLQPVEQAVKIILRMHNHWAIPFHLHSHRLSDQTSHRLSPPPPQPQPQPQPQPPAFRPPPVRLPANRTPPPMPPPFTPLPSSAVGTQSVQPPPPPVRPYRPPRYSSPPETLVAASTTTASRLFRFIPTPGFRPHTSANNSSNKM